MPQSVNSWPYKYENQSLDAQNPWKKKGTVAFAYNSSGTETRASLEIIGHLANEDETLPQSKCEGPLGNYTEVVLWLPHTGI